MILGLIKSVSFLLQPKIEALRLIFSIAVNSGLKPIPCSITLTNLPLYFTSPDDGVVILEITLMKVDLPEPFLPRRATFSPLKI